MIKVGIGCFVLNQYNQILIGKRINSIGHGTLALPGGHLEYGESFEQCAAREVQEETSLKPSSMCDWKLGTTVGSVTESQHYVTIFMVAKQATSTPLIPLNSEPEKCEGWSWIDWEDLKNFPPSRLFTPLNVLLEERESFRPCIE